MRAETRALIEKSIDALPDVFRTVFVLRALEEMSGEEVAACLDIPEATVRSRFFRARSMLRAALARDVDLALRTGVLVRRRALRPHRRRRDRAPQAFPARRRLTDLQYHPTGDPPCPF